MVNTYAPISYFNCNRCGKKLQKGEKERSELTFYPRCAECIQYELQGIETIEDYNNMLRGQ
jgi:NAD-dependent SIR2 family protein deacetylase